MGIAGGLQVQTSPAKALARSARMPGLTVQEHREIAFASDVLELDYYGNIPDRLANVSPVAYV